MPAMVREMEAEMESLKEVLMRRDGLTRREAAEAIAEARERVREGEDPEEVLAEEFGLEPDYVFDLREGSMCLICGRGKR